MLLTTTFFLIYCYFSLILGRTGIVSSIDQHQMIKSNINIH